jgi:hypothetical protein
VKSHQRSQLCSLNLGQSHFKLPQGSILPLTWGRRGVVELVIGEERVLVITGGRSQRHTQGNNERGNLMKYLRLRFKLWRINVAIQESDVITAARLLSVSFADKTTEEFVFALEIAHRELMNEAIFAGKK